MNQTIRKLKKAVRLPLMLLVAAVLIIAAVAGIYDAVIPDRVSYFRGESIPVYLFADPHISRDDSASDSVDYKLLGCITVKRVTAEAYDKLLVWPGGMPFGVKFFTHGVMVVGFCDIQRDGEAQNPAKQAGLRQKDVITEVNGKPLADAMSLTEAVEACEGAPLTLTYLRGDETHKATVTPISDPNDGKYKTGLLVRDSGAGIGTVSFILPDSGYFAGLGHGICDTETGKLVPIERGTVVDVTISGIQKGVSGTPGEIRGFFTSGKRGTLLGNTECGVYGVLTQRPATYTDKPVPIALKDDLQEGEAHILCTLDDGGIEKYSVSISDIDKNATAGKCFTVKVTDPRLLEKTGGIVQGMSGSPILQNGKLVGAVTHVLINDPTRGYGIFIENMLAGVSNELPGAA